MRKLRLLQSEIRKALKASDERALRAADRLPPDEAHRQHVEREKERKSYEEYDANRRK
jgi:hypothetical protein